MIVGFSIAACSGVFAALASVFSKVALEDGGILIRAATCPWIQDNYCDTASTQKSQVIHNFHSMQFYYLITSSKRTQSSIYTAFPCKQFNGHQCCGILYEVVI